MDTIWKDPRGLDPPIMPGSPKNRVSFVMLEASREFFRVLDGFEDLDARDFETTHVLGRRGGGAFCTPARY